MNSKSYPHGIDCVWLAVDAVGHVAAFVTGGSGPIPAVLTDAAAGPMDDVEARIGELPRAAVAQLLVPLKRPDDFIDIAERGIFAYDWSDVHRTKADEIFAYELIAVPSNPIRAARLPEDLAALAETSRLRDLTFQTTKRLDVRQLLDCVSGQ